MLLMAVALVVTAGCTAQRRAARQVRRAVALCPELVQVKAHPIDTVLTAPAFADCATVPLAAVLAHDTLYAATPHGTVVVSLRQSDSALRVGFVAAPQQVRYRDTVRYQQVVVNPAPQPASGHRLFDGLVVWLLGIGLGITLCACLALRNK